MKTKNKKLYMYILICEQYVVVYPFNILFCMPTGMQFGTIIVDIKDFLELFIIHVIHKIHLYYFIYIYSFYNCKTQSVISQIINITAKELYYPMVKDMI